MFTNTAARARIEENYQKKILALKRKQAIFDKLQAVFDIGISTAIAVSKAIAKTPETFGMPFSAYAIAQGLVQTAVVLAKPLPKYEKGRKGGRAEWALVNEKGAELIEKNGRLRVANKGKKGVAFLEEGESVKTAEQTKTFIDKMSESNDHNRFIDSLLEGTGIVRRSEQDKTDKIANAIAASYMSEQTLSTAFGSALSKLPFTYFEFAEKGIKQFAKTMSSKTELINSRNTMGGNG